jgi:orotidine-5'-phosphate decarboxylase
MRPFADRLIRAIRDKGTPCIVGLDPAIERMPADFLAEHGHTEASSLEGCAAILLEYSRLVIDQTHDLVPAVKPQSAYFERYGSAGVRALEQTAEYARRQGLLVILDAKRGDIGTTSEAYARAYLAASPPRAFEYDGMTLHPYLGADSLGPFAAIAERDGKGLFICVLNTNPGAIAFQTLQVDGKPLYEVVAEMVRPLTEVSRGMEGYSSIGAVVGASSPEHARRMRKLLPSSIFLVPGMGAQGGSLESVRACFNEDGLGAIISSSRSIMYPASYGSSSRSLGECIRDAALGAIRDVRECLAMASS